MVSVEEFVGDIVLYIQTELGTINHVRRNSPGSLPDFVEGFPLRAISYIKNAAEKAVGEEYSRYTLAASGKIEEIHRNVIKYTIRKINDILIETRIIV